MHFSLPHFPFLCFESLPFNLFSNPPFTTPFLPSRSTQPCIHLGSLNRVPALIGWGNGGNLTSAGRQVTLCDPIWHVSSRSGAVLVAQTAIRFLPSFFSLFFSSSLVLFHFFLHLVLLSFLPPLFFLFFFSRHLLSLYSYLPAFHLSPFLSSFTSSLLAFFLFSVS